MRETKWITRCFAAALSVIYLTTQCVFAHAAEASFWSDRRRSVEGAGLPDAGPGQVLAQLPPAASQPLSLAIAKQLPKNVSGDSDGPVMRLLGALPAPHGSVRKVVLPPGGRFHRAVIHVQDVHLNPEAQG